MNTVETDLSFLFTLLHLAWIVGCIALIAVGVFRKKKGFIWIGALLLLSYLGFMAWGIHEMGESMKDFNF
ncbi:hypothetical protein R9C00_01105 [Flammeovirgaceae bacterium SG7u.111]|nr:hypothetical protein [Flammeovirgaceae bacterium SG7u.132]WPO36046.1 hypothetical protein R9C00_01105 [Flammeovirgaceae bacterium SG7u.111]